MFIKVTVNGATDRINTDHVKAIRWNGTSDGTYRVLFTDGDDVVAYISRDELDHLDG